MTESAGGQDENITEFQTPERNDALPVVVIGASSGGMDALKKLVGGLPADFPAPLCVVWHIAPDSTNLLPSILAGAGPLPATLAVDGVALEAGHIYVAPADHHLLIEKQRLRVTHGPRENRFRPSVDVLFRSAALACGPRTIAVVLSGSLDDGSSGVYAVKQKGGLTIVQDPVDARQQAMPINAMKAAPIDHCVPADAMPALLTRLLAEVLAGPQSHEEGRTRVSQSNHAEKMEIEVRIAGEDNALETGVMRLGNFSPFTCPECHAALLRILEGSIVRFRCHTGHAYSLKTLLVGVSFSVEKTLWSALRAVEESQLIMSHMTEHLQGNGDEEASQLLRRKIEQAKKRAGLVRQAVLSTEILSTETLSEELPRVSSQKP